MCYYCCHRSADYKKVPIAIINETQINGSEAILDSILTSPIVGELLAKKWSVDSNDNKEVMTMKQFKDSENAKRWFRFAADDLGAVLYPNICGTLSDSFDAFSYVKDVDSFTGMQKVRYITNIMDMRYQICITHFAFQTDEHSISW